MKTNPTNPQEKKPAKRSGNFIFRLFKIIAVLVVIIAILIWLIFQFGLGGGNGAFLSKGSGTTNSGKSETSTPAKTPETKTNTTTPETKIETETKNKTPDVANAAAQLPIRFEMHISFEPDPNNTDSAKEFVCQIERINTAQKNETADKKLITCRNMPDFEAALEKEIQEWRLAFDQLQIEPEQNTRPILQVHMIPFPGEGVFRKIESIVKNIDPKIAIMRTE
ncbi:MAG: hypothetical protein LBQ66_01765 [Planctomycetaceae bacterium]|jgi:cytoskeletal protein RodZ|nr:hypothetical protein [Planctomycetaceae bacterium]